MEILFRGNPLAGVTVSMTINSPAPVIWAMYLAVAEKQGVDWSQISGTLQNDILKEYIAQKEYIFPPRPSMRLVTDVIEYATRHVPRFNPISISGYHIREAGSTAVQELAFTLRDGMEYVEWGVARGLPVDSFAPRPQFLFQLAQTISSRRSPSFARHAGFGPKQCGIAMGRKTKGAGSSARTRKTAGCSLTWQQPYNNIVRTTLAGARGGAGRHAVTAHQFAR